MIMFAWFKNLKKETINTDIYHIIIILGTIYVWSKCIGTYSYLPWIKLVSGSISVQASMFSCGWDKMDAILQMIISCMKFFLFWLNFHWNLFPMVWLTICHHMAWGRFVYCRICITRPQRGEKCLWKLIHVICFTSILNISTLKWIMTQWNRFIELNISFTPHTVMFGSWLLL